MGASVDNHHIGWRAAAGPAIAAALVAGLVEGTAAALSSFAAPLSVTSRLVLVLSTMGVFAPLGLALAVVQAGLASLARRGLAVPRALVAPALAVGLAGVAIFARVAERVLAADLQNHHLGGLLLAVLAAGVALVALVVPTIARLDGHIARLRPWSSHPALPSPLWLALPFAAAVVVWPYREDLALVDMRPFYGIGLLLALDAALLWPLRRPTGRLFGRAGLITLTASAMVLLTVALLVLAPRQAAPLRRGGLLAWTLLRGERQILDVDGDGLAGVLGGTDCAPFDPAVNPDADDPAGDGIDSDCDGRDGVPMAGLFPAAALSPLPAERPAGGYDIVFVVIDTVRADHVGHLGYERDTTPNLDALAKESVVFERAVSPSTATRYSLAGFLYGQGPATIRWHTRGKGKTKEWFIAETEKPLAALLRGAGLRTHAVLSSFRIFKPYFGLARGFDVYDNKTVKQNEFRVKSKRGGETTAVAKAAHKKLSKSKQPFFLYVHYLDVHGPYLPPEGFDRFGDLEIDHYDGLICWVDHQVGQLVDALKASGRWDRTVVIVTSDHGEEFGEHGGTHHGRKLYQELTHVPLLVRVPGVAPRRNEGHVSGLDLVPTMLDLARVPPERWPLLPGRSLVPALGRDDPDRVTFIENGRYGQVKQLDRAIWMGDMKLIFMAEDDTLELYDLGSDPGEAQDLAGQGHPAEDELRALLGSFRQELRGIRSTKQASIVQP